MFEIINTRYERMRPTILISNQSKEELSAFIGERVIDRMNDGGAAARWRLPGIATGRGLHNEYHG